MLVVFSVIFVADRKITFFYNFVASTSTFNSLVEIKVASTTL